MRYSYTVIFYILLLFAGNLKKTSLVFGRYGRRKITSQECSVKCYPESPVHKCSGQQHIFYKYGKYDTCTHISDSNFLSYFETITVYTVYSIKEIALKSVKRVVSIVVLAYKRFSNVLYDQSWF